MTQFVKVELGSKALDWVGEELSQGNTLSQLLRARLEREEWSAFTLLSGPVSEDISSDFGGGQIGNGNFEALLDYLGAEFGEAPTNFVVEDKDLLPEASWLARTSYPHFFLGDEIFHHCPTAENYMDCVIHQGTWEMHMNGFIIHAVALPRKNEVSIDDPQRFLLELAKNTVMVIVTAYAGEGYILCLPNSVKLIHNMAMATPAD